MLGGPRITTEKVIAPFNEEQVRSLNEFQESGYMHPFTCCGDNGCRDRLGTKDHERLLIATEQGWTCPTCPVTQQWAWRWMADYSWKEVFGSMNKFINDALFVKD